MKFTNRLNKYIKSKGNHIYAVKKIKKQVKNYKNPNKRLINMCNRYLKKKKIEMYHIHKKSNIKREIN